MTVYLVERRLHIRGDGEYVFLPIACIWSRIGPQELGRGWCMGVVSRMARGLGMCIHSGVTHPRLLRMCRRLMTKLILSLEDIFLLVDL
jgi:hypothetical protein